MTHGDFGSLEEQRCMRGTRQPFRRVPLIVSLLGRRNRYKWQARARDLLQSYCVMRIGNFSHNWNSPAKNNVESKTHSIFISFPSHPDQIGPATGFLLPTRRLQRCFERPLLPRSTDSLSVGLTYIRPFRPIDQEYCRISTDNLTFEVLVIVGDTRKVVFCYQSYIVSRCLFPSTETFPKLL